MYGFGRRGYGRSSFAGDLMALEAEEEAIEDLAEGNVFGAMMDMQAAADFSRGNFLGGIVDETIADDDWF